jgi:hypothetical protein
LPFARALGESASTRTDRLLQIRRTGVDKAGVMFENTMTGSLNDDPRKLSALIERVCDLALAHSVPSVIAGLAAKEGDLVFPEYVNFLQAALRVEDGIFRMTRERAVVHLADVDAATASAVLERLTTDFCDEFPSMSRPDYELRLYEVEPSTGRVRVKDVLTEIFAARTLH